MRASAPVPPRLLPGCRRSAAGGAGELPHEVRRRGLFRSSQSVTDPPKAERNADTPARPPSKQARTHRLTPPASTERAAIPLFVHCPPVRAVEPRQSRSSEPRSPPNQRHQIPPRTTNRKPPKPPTPKRGRRGTLPATGEFIDNYEANLVGPRNAASSLCVASSSAISHSQSVRQDQPIDLSFFRLRLSRSTLPLNLSAQNSVRVLGM